MEIEGRNHGGLFSLDEDLYGDRGENVPVA